MAKFHSYAPFLGMLIVMLTLHLDTAKETEQTDDEDKILEESLRGERFLMHATKAEQGRIHYTASYSLSPLIDMLSLRS